MECNWKLIFCKSQKRTQAASNLFSLALEIEQVWEFHMFINKKQQKKSMQI